MAMANVLIPCIREVNLTYKKPNFRSQCTLTSHSLTFLKTYKKVKL
jgi:hypothetical protein